MPLFIDDCLPESIPPIEDCLPPIEDCRPPIEDCMLDRKFEMEPEKFGGRLVLFLLPPLPAFFLPELSI